MNDRKARKIVSEKAQKLLEAMKKRDRQASKHWKPYDGPPDWDFIAGNAPNKHLEE